MSCLTLRRYCCHSIGNDFSWLMSSVGMKDVSMLSVCQGNSLTGLFAKQRKYQPTGVSVDVTETSIFIGFRAAGLLGCMGSAVFVGICSIYSILFACAINLSLQVQSIMVLYWFCTPFPIPYFFSFCTAPLPSGML